MLLTGVLRISARQVHKVLPPDARIGWSEQAQNVQDGPEIEQGSPNFDQSALEWQWEFVDSTDKIRITPSSTKAYKYAADMDLEANFLMAYFILAAV